MNFIPEFYYRQSVAYRTLIDMMKNTPNDQDLGKEVRKYLNDILDGKILIAHNSIELDEKQD